LALRNTAAVSDELRQKGGTLSAAAGTAGPLAGTDVVSPELQAPVCGGRHAPPGLAQGTNPWPVAAATRAFAAQPLQVASARRFVAGVLTGLGVADDVVLCISELASNAVLHSSSRQPGGQFIIRVWTSAAGRIRAEVEDHGGPWTPDPDQDEERGRGLLIVARLATRWGITGSPTGRVAWLEIHPG
jgi:serine/threonine-protein kinase RsbW